MNIEECKKKDGKYFLLECEDLMSEFECKIKDGKEILTEIQLLPFQVKPVKEDNFGLLCSLHESENWEKFEEMNKELIEEKTFKRR